MVLNITRLTPPPANALLQPLREVGTMEKTQFWDIDDVMEALRIANRKGIPLEKLRGTSVEALTAV
jgi:hypothetical protein